MDNSKELAYELFRDKSSHYKKLSSLSFKLSMHSYHLLFSLFLFDDEEHP